MKKWCDKIFDNEYYWLSLLCIISLIPIIYISFYNFPQRDDFGYSTLVHHLAMEGADILEIISGAWKTSMEFMQSWQGLYSAAFVLALQPAAFGLKYSFIGPVFLITVLCISVFKLSNTILKIISFEDKKIKIWIPTIICFYIIQCMPDPTEGIFWFNGAANYTLFWSLVLINIAYILQAFYFKKNNNITLIASVLLSIIISGGNHISTFLNILICAFFLLYSVITKNKKRAIMSSFSLTAACVGFYIVMTAPGTQIRRAALVKQPVVSSIINTAHRFLSISALYVTVPYILFMIMLIPALYKVAKKLGEIRLLHLVSATMIFGVCTCGMICVPYYAMGDWGSGRVQNIIFFTWIIGIIIICTMILAYLHQRFDAEECIHTFDSLLKYIKPIISVFIISFILYSGGEEMGISTSAKAVQEIISGEPKKLHAEYVAREEMMARGETVFERYKHRDTMIYFTDIYYSKDNWMNLAFSRYYNIEWAYVIEEIN